MGQCGCGDLHVTQAIPIGDDVLAVDEYYGCEECHPALAVRLYLFTRESWDGDWGRWFRGDVMQEPLVANDVGGDGGHGRWVELIGGDDLVRAVEEDEELRDVQLDDYADLADLLRDHGLTLLKAAMRARKRKGTG